MNPPTGTLNRRSPPSPVQMGFWLLASMILVNIDHLLNLTIGTGWPSDLGIAICCVLLCLVVRIPLRRAVGPPGLLIVAALFSYLFIGLSVAFVTGLPWYAVAPLFPLHIGFAALIVVATALGASITLRQVGVERLLKGILVILTVTCILILASPLLRDYLYTPPAHLRDVGWIARDRFTGPFVSPNMAGMACCYTVALALFFLASGTHRTFSGLALILGSMAGILTFSRVAILALGIIFIFFLCAPESGHHRKRTSVVRWMIVLIVGTATFAASKLQDLPLKQKQALRIEALGRMFDPSVERADMRPRILWPLALSRIAESPLFGHGILRFHYLKGAPRCRLGVLCGSHNSYLMLWGEAGIIPVVLFLLSIGSLLWSCFALSESFATPLVVPWVVVFALACMTNDTVAYSPWSAFILGLSCALVAFARWESRLSNRGEWPRHE